MSQINDEDLYEAASDVELYDAVDSYERSRSQSFFICDSMQMLLAFIELFNRK